MDKQQTANLLFHHENWMTSHRMKMVKFEEENYYLDDGKRRRYFWMFLLWNFLAIPFWVLGKFIPHVNGCYAHFYCQFFFFVVFFWSFMPFFRFIKYEHSMKSRGVNHNGHISSLYVFRMSVGWTFAFVCEFIVNLPYM